MKPRLYTIEIDEEYADIIDRLAENDPGGAEAVINQFIHVGISKFADFVEKSQRKAKKKKV